MRRRAELTIAPVPNPVGRRRPSGSPIMRQSWGKMLFMHWKVPAITLRQMIPPPLEIDTFNGSAWIGVTPFTLWNVRPAFLPAVPWVSKFHEVNVRTYVSRDGVPGVWFFSLDANSRLAVLAAKTFFALPYEYSEIDLEETAHAIHYKAVRPADDLGGELRATWAVGEHLPQPRAGSLEHFLVERYCLYTIADDRLCRSRIHHRPWRLHEASVSRYKCTLFQANELPIPEDDPLVHAAEPVDVEIWPLEDA